jgi:hypothetical protein
VCSLLEMVRNSSRRTTHDRQRKITINVVVILFTLRYYFICLKINKIDK